MPDEKALKEALNGIHLAIEQAEYALSRVGERLQFLISPEGDIEIVRRSKTGETLRPKVVVAAVKGCDPLLWRPGDRSWRLSLLGLAEIEPPIPELSEPLRLRRSGEPPEDGDPDPPLAGPRRVEDP